MGGHWKPALARVVALEAPSPASLCVVVLRARKDGGVMKAGRGGANLSGCIG